MDEKNTKPFVEIGDFEAKIYDRMLDFLSLGKYTKLINKVIAYMRIKPDDKILDLGAGTGKNACIISKYLSTGKVIGLEISKEMQRQFLKRKNLCKKIDLLPYRIENPLPFKEEFDKVFISFVLHGFTQENRIKILVNALRALKPEGYFYIFDYNNFDIDYSPFFVKYLVRKVECPLAEDFINRKLKKMLAENGFTEMEEKIFYKFLRLSISKKV